MDAPLSTATAPSARRARISELLPFAVLGAWSLLVAVLLARLGVHNHYVFRDEINEILFGRDVARHVPHAVSGGVARGPERLTGFFAAAAALATHSPTRQLELLHLWSAVCQGLVALPLWLAARELGLGRWQALVPATLGSAGSFAFYGVLTLPTSVALLSSMLMLCAMLHALRSPGLRTDVLVVATLALTVLARIGWAPLVAALVPATLAVCWLERPAGETFGGWLRPLPRRLRRRHPLLAPLAGLLLLVAVIAGPSLLLGGEQYGGIRIKAHIVPSVLWDNTRVLGAHLALGVAIVPFVLALPVIVRGLVRPPDPVEGGFAWLLLGFVVIFSWAYYASMNEDRYFAVLAPPLILAGTLACFRRPPPLWSVLASGAFVTVLVATSYASPTSNVFGYFVAPTSRFLDGPLVGTLTLVLPGSHAVLAAVLAGVAALVAAIVVVVAARWSVLGRVRVTIVGTLLGGLLAFQLVTMDHPARHFTDSVGIETLSAEQLEFVDRLADGGEVRPLARDGVVDPVLDAQMQMLQAFNTSIAPPLPVSSGASDPVLTPSVSIDWRSGRTTVAGTPPALLLQIAGTASVAFAGEVLPSNPQFPWAQLVRLDIPLRATWVERGAQLDGYPLAGAPIEVRIFPTGMPNRCLSGMIVAYPSLKAGLLYRLSGGPRPLRGIVRPSKPTFFKLRIAGSHPRTLRLSGEGGRPPDGIRRGPTLFNLNVARCSR